jgi:hypothetical protein
VVFVFQHQDASAFAPYDVANPAFGQALRRAYHRGVEVEVPRDTYGNHSVRQAACDSVVPFALSTPPAWHKTVDGSRGVQETQVSCQGSEEMYPFLETFPGRGWEKDAWSAEFVV